MPDNTRATIDHTDAVLEQIRRDALRQVRQAARMANVASAALGLPVVVVYLRDEATVATSTGSAA